MCGRYWLTSPADVLISRFRVRGEPAPLHPRWNAAPGQDLPVVRLLETGARVLEPMRWGLVPAWVADPSDAGRPINARSETAAAKPSFRESFRRRRALVPADGFYEWRRRGPESVPFAFRARSREPFAIAGLWDEWQAREGPPLRTFALLTTDANGDVAPVHDRMPVILERGAEDLWLHAGPEDVARLHEILRPLPDGALESFAVSNRLNSSRADDPSVQDPSPPPAPRPGAPAGLAPPAQRGLFGEDGDDET
ncbi:MAG: SOS response-associated peptidase [Acidobacteriota bacterium]|nr:SOS response-associated peptidase [Acidobacteriota bacterium]